MRLRPDRVNPMKITFLEHSGFCCRTAAVVLVFDYFKIRKGLLRSAVRFEARHLFCFARASRSLQFFDFASAKRAGCGM